MLVPRRELQAVVAPLIERSACQSRQEATDRLTFRKSLGLSPTQIQLQSARSQPPSR